MDRRVKERLVGASILVVLIVLIVPELLSGPAPAPTRAPARPGLSVAAAPEPVRSVTVDLTTSKPMVPEPAPEPVAASAASAATPDTAPAASAVASAAASAAATTPAAATAAPATPAAAPAATVPLEPPPPAPTSVSPARAGHGWAVQLGSFASRANADKLTRQLKSQGFAAYELSGGSGTSARYRVRVGPMADRNAAAQTAAKLKTLGHASTLVAPAS